MKKMHFKVAIKASRETAWKILWEDGTLRQWASIVDPGTYMLGKLEEGKTIQFNSEEGYGVTSFVDKLIPNEYVLLKHKADTKNYGNNDREDQWTGGNEITGELIDAEGNPIADRIMKLNDNRYAELIAKQSSCANSFGESKDTLFNEENSATTAIRSVIKNSLRSY